jgi:hypothetical protein
VDAAEVPADAAPLARGVSHSFDSLEATQRLAVLTGAAAAAAAAAAANQPKPAAPPSMSATAPVTLEVGPTPAKPASPAEAERQTATQAIGSIPRPVTRTGWRRRDWLLVGGAALAGVVVAGVILKKRG